MTTPDLNRVGIYDRPQPVPLGKRLYRWWLLFLRSWYDWRCHRHALLERRCYVSRRLVLIALAKEDEK